MANVKFFNGENIPLEMHKVRIVQKLNLRPVRERVRAMTEAGFNTFLLRNEDVFLDMLTDSGVNAMSDQQQAAMMLADDSYAGSATFYRLEKKLQELFGMDIYYPVHQGRAAESILAAALVTRPGMIVPMNYHFTTAKSHIVRMGGVVEELVSSDSLNPVSDDPFKGNLDISALHDCIARHGAANIAFLRVEAGTNLIGGQPVSLQNFKDATAIARENGITTVLDASLLQDNLYFIHAREEAAKGMSIREITKEIADQFDIIYFSARKLGFARGGGICTRNGEAAQRMKPMVPMYEGFLTYGGMSVREMEAITVGLEETMDVDVISQGPQFIAYAVDELRKNGVPVVTPAGGLGVHLDARRFLPHLNDNEYASGALAAAAYIAGGIRGMERGRLSEQRNPDGTEPVSHMELLRLAVPRRVFTLSQMRYVIDRITWLYQNRHLIGGLRWVEEPEVLRFFFGRLAPTSNWPQKLAEQFEKDMGESL